MSSRSTRPSRYVIALREMGVWLDVDCLTARTDMW